MEQRFDNTKRMENLSYAVKYYRNKKGYTQEALAEKLGISRPTHGGNRGPKYETGSVFGTGIQYCHCFGDRALLFAEISFGAMKPQKKT